MSEKDESGKSATLSFKELLQRWTEKITNSINGAEAANNRMGGTGNNQAAAHKPLRRTASESDLPTNPNTEALNNAQRPHNNTLPRGSHTPDLNKTERNNDEANGPGENNNKGHSALTRSNSLPNRDSFLVEPKGAASPLPSSPGAESPRVKRKNTHALS